MIWTKIDVSKDDDFLEDISKYNDLERQKKLSYSFQL